MAPLSSIDLPPLLTPTEVAELLGASERTVRRLAEEGVLTRIRVGHRTSRYTRRSVLALIDPSDDHDPGANRVVEKEGAGAAHAGV
jgi:excisionase family DNA binding protein